MRNLKEHVNDEVKVNLINESTGCSATIKFKLQQKPKVGDEHKNKAIILNWTRHNVAHMKKKTTSSKTMHTFFASTADASFVKRRQLN